MWTIHIDRFLASEGRQRSAVKGDGNCLFRAMSKQLFGTDTLHRQLREFLAGVIVLNHDRYQQFYIPSETTTFQQHQKSIHQLGVWGTQVEIQAASDSYQMPVYVCSPHPTTRQIRWLRFKPSYSPQVPDTSQLPQLSLLYTNGHIEIAHTGCQYDSICTNNGQTLQFPELPDEDKEYEVCRISDNETDSDSD